MASQSEIVYASEGEVIGDIFYIADDGHRYEPGQRFHDYSSREGITTADSVHSSYWVALKPDKTRGVLERSRGMGTQNHHTRADQLLAKYPDAHVHYIRHPYRDHSDSVPTWIDYAWNVSLAVVNQFPYVYKWRTFVARSAHEFDWTMSAHSMRNLSENERWAVQHQMYGLIASPSFLLTLLESTDPQELLNGKLLWKIYEGEVNNVLEGLCHECEDIATFARRFAHKANLTLFRGALISGKIHKSDRNFTPWGLGEVVSKVVVPSGQTPTEEKINAFHTSNLTETVRALDYYDAICCSGRTASQP